MIKCKYLFGSVGNYIENTRFKFGNQVSSIVLNKKISVSENRKISHELEINKNKYKVYSVYYPVGNGIFNIDKSIEDIKWILENEIKEVVKN